MIERTSPRDAKIHDGRQVAQNISGIEPSHVARYRWAVERLSKLFPNGATILDAACGVGYGSKMLAEAGHRVTSIDISSAAIDFARTYYTHPEILYVQGDILEIKLPRVDAVVSFETVEHVEHDGELLRKFWASGSIILLSVPNADVFALSGEVARHHWRHYTDKQFRTLLYDCGYERMTYFGSINKWEDKVTPNQSDKKFLIYLVGARWKPSQQE